jgi:hypothetical protein
VADSCRLPVTVGGQGVHVRCEGPVGGRWARQGLEAHLTDWLEEL